MMIIIYILITIVIIMITIIIITMGTTDLYDVLLRLIHTAVLPRLDEGEYVGAKNRAVHMICIFPLLPYSLPTLCF